MAAIGEEVGGVYGQPVDGEVGYCEGEGIGDVLVGDLVSLSLRGEEAKKGVGVR